MNNNFFKKSQSNSRNFIFIIVIIAIIALFLAFSNNSDSDSKSTSKKEEKKTYPKVYTQEEKLMDDDSIKGDKNAPITIIEFSDYECPYCVRWVKNTLPDIKKKYIDKGIVKLVFRDYPLNFHEYAQKAAEAAECAGEQGKYYEMHDKLFLEGVKGGVKIYKEYAEEINLDLENFNSCLDNGEMAEEVAKDMEDAKSYGVRGTPAFIVNGNYISGAQPFKVFEEVIEAELE